MRYLYLDQFRKIKFNKLNFISLSLLVIVISLTFTMIKTSIIRLEENYEPYLESQNVEDFQFGISNFDIELLTATELMYVCEELDVFNECLYYISYGTEGAYAQLNNILNQKMEEHPELIQPIIDDYIEQITEDYDFVIEEKWVSDIQDGENKYRFLSITQEIDIPYIIEGTLPVDDYDIAVYPTFGESYDLNINDTVDILGNTYKITAYIYSPDYTFPIYYMNALDLDTDTIVLTTKTTIETLNTNIDKMYVGKGDLSQLVEIKTLSDMTETDFEDLNTNTQHINKIRPATANYRIQTLNIEVDNANIFMDAFIIMFILFTGLLLTIFLKRYIEKNKKDIEILQSLGYSNLEITKALMVFPICISLTSMIGYILGLLGSVIMFDLYASRYLFPKAGFSLYSNVFLLAVVIPVLFILLVSYIFIYKSLKRKQKRHPIIKLRVFKFTPIKTILQTFVLLFTVSVMVLFSINANNLFDNFVETTKIGNDYVEAIRLNYFTNEEIDDSYETFSRIKVKVISINETEADFSFQMYGIDSDTTLKALIDGDASNNELLNDGVIISEYVKYNHDLELGDEITFTVKGTTYTKEIVGFTNELVESNGFMLKEELNQSYLLDNDYYNGIYTTDTLYQSGNISIRISYTQAIDEVASTMRASSIIVNLLLGLSAIIGLFMFGFIITNYLSENRLSISILKSIGYNNKEINIKYITAIVVTFGIGFIIAIPTTRLLFDLLLESIISQLGYVMFLDLTLVNIVISLTILIIIFIGTIITINRYYEKISISEILKTNIK